jgi:hypothetical protein
MDWLMQLGRRIGMWFRRGELEQDLDEEMKLHLEMRAAQARAAGHSDEAARLEARRRFGSQALAKDESRDAWSLRWLDDLVKDLRIALRGIGRAPASPRSPCWPWRSASPPTARPSAWSTPSSSARCPTPIPIASSWSCTRAAIR